MYLGSYIQMCIDDKNHFKILECLAFQALGDIFHILISPGRDDYAKLHS